MSGIYLITNHQRFPFARGTKPWASTPSLSLLSQLLPQSITIQCVGQSIASEMLCVCNFVHVLFSPQNVCFPVNVFSPFQVNIIQQLTFIACQIRASPMRQLLLVCPLYRGENQDKEQVICSRLNLGCIRTGFEFRKFSSRDYAHNNYTKIQSPYSLSCSL